MLTVAAEPDAFVSIPSDVVDLPSFLRWRDHDDINENLKAHYLGGEVWVDLSMEELFTHNGLKKAITKTLSELVDDAQLGIVFMDGALVQHDDSDLGTEADVTVVFNESIRSGKVAFAGRGQRINRIIGSPDLVVEVMSPRSVHKDRVRLPQLYHAAGIREYWLVDARHDDVIFDIYEYATGSYVKHSMTNGVVLSPLLQKNFSLSLSLNPIALPVWRLEYRSNDALNATPSSI